MTDNNLRGLVDASGFAFQLAVEHLVHATAGRFRVLATEHAWVHPRSRETGFADIILEEVSDKLAGLRLVIECKRVRDGQWVFLRPDESAKMARSRFPTSPDELQSRVIAHWTAVDESNSASGTDEVICKPVSEYSSFCVVRGSGESQKPMLERVAAQLLDATEAIADEQFRLDVAHRTNRRLQKIWVYTPVIVTSAQLSVCELDPSQISLADGLLPQQATFKHASVMRFTKNLAFDTNIAEHTTLAAVNASKDRTVFIVSSTSLIEFLNAFDWTGGIPKPLRAFMDV